MLPELGQVALLLAGVAAFLWQADGNPLGTPEAELHWSVDVSDFVDTKRAALACHASQSDAAGILQMPAEAFDAAFGREFYLEPGRAPGMVEGWPFGAPR